MSLPSRYRRNTITRYGNRIAILSELNEPRTSDACDGATGHATPMAERELMERFDMSRPMDQIDNSSTKQLQTEHHGQTSSRRSQSDVRLENCESQARRDLPTSLTASQHGPVTLLRLSRPAKRNALDDATIAGIESFFSDPPEQTRAIILHGEGKHFSAGVDLSTVTDVSALASVRRSQSWYRAFDRIENGRVPVVAVLQGGVIGGGLELAAAAHIRVAERSAFYALPESARGIRWRRRRRGHTAPDRYNSDD